MAGRLGRCGWVIAGCVLLVVLLHALGLHLLGRMLPGSAAAPEAGELNQAFITRSIQLPNDLNPGTYFLRLTGDGFNETRMILIQ